MQLPTKSQVESWPSPNYTYPVSRHYENTIITCAILPITIQVAALRIFSKIRLSRYWGVDDTMMIASLVPTLSYVILGLIWDSKTGWRHTWDYPVFDLESGLRVILSSQILFTASSTLMKISTLLFIRRLLMNSQVLLKSFIIVFITALATQAVVFIFLQLFQCSPISCYWSVSTKPQKCIRESHLLMAAGISNTVSTPLIFIIFLAQHRLTITVLFVTGLTILLAGAARTYYLVNAVGSIDRMWNYYPGLVASSIELFAGILSAFLPPLQFLHANASPKPRSASPAQENESKDEIPFTLKPTIYREVYREQHSEMYETPASSKQSEDESQNSSQNSLPSIPIQKQGDHLLHYLHSFSEDSQLLSPIIEESFGSRFSTQSTGPKRYVPSCPSSISSFNVATPSACHTAPRSASTGIIDRIYSVSHLDTIRNSFEVASSYKKSDISLVGANDVENQSVNPANLLRRSRSQFGYLRINQCIGNPQFHQLSLFEFERHSDWNRDLEGRSSIWGDFGDGYRNDDFPYFRTNSHRSNEGGTSS
ncbi:putative integral membrane protein [Golovinomyces cichoracearum]|uniref:Putative integral membrane protein n=1 Tax=Golovinomyces cichoracearum TaxID=62708 RepID=A0A420HHV7_9PEZI|nr:putative integral membrane protein [Golovinomyces cichoracearum]